MFFRFRNISGRYFQSRHQISIFFKKVGNTFFSPYFLTTNSKNFHFFFPDRPIWSNHYWNFVEWIQEKFSHTYHAPISCLHPIFEIAKKILFLIFYAIFLKEYFKEFPEKVLSARFQLFFVRI